YQLKMESNSSKAGILTEAFISGKDLNVTLDYTGRLNKIQTADLQKIASDYCNNNYMLFDIGTGKIAEGEKLEKPDIKPITQSSGKKSAYALAFEELNYEKQALPVKDFEEVIIKPINTKSKLYYTQNTENEVFSLILKYGIGTEKMPYLEYSTALMNNAGIMGGYTPQEFKKAITELNVTCRYTVDDDYLYVVMEGFEDNLTEALGLLTRQILMPQLDEKQFLNIQGSIYQSRMRESKDPNVIAEALAEYMIYGDKSVYLDRPTLYNIFTEMGLSKLTGEFQRATDYEAEVHYCGKLPFEQAYDILSQYLPLKANEKESSSPEWKAYKEYSQNTIYFLPRNDTKQAKVYFFAPGNNYKPENDLKYKAFNRYFGAGGLSSLVYEEIREKNSMAYTAYGVLVTPPLPDKQVGFQGYVGTQSDKVNDAIGLYMKLVNDMPLYQEREKNLKSYLELEPFTTQPDFRSKSQQYEDWKRLGYTTNPALKQEAEIQQFNLQQMLEFYQQELKGKPLAIAIVGDPKLIDLKALAAYGKVVKMSSAKLFSKD
ncbi:MAG: insulinase family protein, partial [Bacteroidales bacterium]|nr:insulinase family protein [Bacteroidales bacterium]